MLTIVCVVPQLMIPPRPHKRKYLFDPNAHESVDFKKIRDYNLLNFYVYKNLPPGRISFETAAAAAMSRPGMRDVS